MNNYANKPAVIVITRKKEITKIPINLYLVLAIIAFAVIIASFVRKVQKEEPVVISSVVQQTATVAEEIVPTIEAPPMDDDYYLIGLLTTDSVDAGLVEETYLRYYFETYPSLQSFIQYSINVMYATKGHGFSDSEVQEIFNAKEWYDNKGVSVDWNAFSKTEQHNLSILTGMRRDLKSH